MYCSRCGTANPDGPDVRFCRSCGAEIAPTAPTTTGYGLPQAQVPPGAFPGVAPAAFPGGGIQAAVFPYGGFWIRLVASLIDGLVMVAAAVVLAVTWGLLGGRSGGAEAAGEGWMPVYYLFTIGYDVLCPPVWGATLGKLAVGYHIVTEDGRHIGLGRSIARCLGYFVSTFGLLLGFIWVGIEARKQGWHDKIAGTFVVRKEFVRP